MEALVYECERCGFIGLYKPDTIADARRCPSCDAGGDQYWTDDEVNDAVRRPPMTKVVN